MSELDGVFYVEKKRGAGKPGIAMAMRVTDEFPWRLGCVENDERCAIARNEDGSWSYTDENGKVHKILPGEGFWILDGFDLNRRPRVKYVKRGTPEYFTYNVVSELGGVIIASLSLLDGMKE